MASNEELRNNLMSFREAFRDYADCYTVIGGTACFILLDEAELEFRATKDIDMILILEDRGDAFVVAFWNYIVEGGYTCGWKESEVHYYRFTNPKEGYPGRIELFSKKGDFNVDSRIKPVHISDDISSLSAIVLDDDFYDFMMQGRRVIDGISILDVEHLIPFKMYAWLNNRKLCAEGKQVNSDDIKKHKNDVFRLIELINTDTRIDTKGNVRTCVDEFLSEIVIEPVSSSVLGTITKDEAIRIFKNVYLS